MERRTFIGLVSVALGGCAGGTDSSSPSDSATSSPEPTSTPSPTRSPTQARPQKAQNLIEEAQEHLQKAATTFNEETNTMYSSSNQVSFDTAPILTALENGRDDLQRANEIATADQKDAIEILRKYADYIQSLTDVLKSIADAYNHMYTAGSYEDADRYNAAADEFRASQKAVLTGKQRHQKASDLQQSLSASVLEEKEVEWSKAKVWVEKLGGILTGLSTLTNGGAQLDEGLHDFNIGIESYNNGNYNDALLAYEKAIAHFREAHTIYRNGEDTAPQSMISQVIYLTCLSEIYRDGSIEYKLAAADAADGNIAAANDHVEEGQSILNKSC